MSLKVERLHAPAFHSGRMQTSLRSCLDMSSVLRATVYGTTSAGLLARSTDYARAATRVDVMERHVHIQKAKSGVI